MSELLDFVRARCDQAEEFAKIARMPARTRERLLREVEVKRRILERHASSDYPYNPDDGPGDYSWTPYCDHCHHEWPCPDLRDLALPYADHPDYRDEWQP